MRLVRSSIARTGGNRPPQDVLPQELSSTGVRSSSAHRGDHLGR